MISSHADGRRPRPSDAARAPRRSRGDAAGDSARRDRRAGRRGPGGSQVYTLHSAEEPYRNLVEQMQEGAVVLTGRGDILYSNARFAALVGEPLESVVGSRIDRFVKRVRQGRFRDAARAPAADDAAAA